MINVHKLPCRAKYESLGMTAAQSKQLEDLSSQGDQHPFKAGRTSDGEIYCVTKTDYPEDPAAFKGYSKYFHVYLGQPGAVIEHPVQAATVLRDGGTTTLTTVDGIDMRFPAALRRKPPTVHGASVAIEMND